MTMTHHDRIEEEESIRLARQWNTFQRNVTDLSEQQIDELRREHRLVASVVDGLSLKRNEYITLTRFLAMIKAFYNEGEKL